MERSIRAKFYYAVRKHAVYRTHVLVLMPYNLGCAILLVLLLITGVLLYPRKQKESQGHYNIELACAFPSLAALLCPRCG
jgi:hypothetical protein